MDLGVDARLAHAPRDELRELRAVIDDQDAARAVRYVPVPVRSELEELDRLRVEVEDRGRRRAVEPAARLAGIHDRACRRASSSPAGA